MSASAALSSFAKTTEQHALEMARRGLRVFRVTPGGKTPYRRGINEATTDASTIRRWFRDEPGLNYGIVTDGLTVLDVDPRKSPDDWLDELAALGALPQTFTVATPSGGMHIYLNGFEAGQRPISSSIDVRGRGGYVVGPGSVFLGREYRIHLDAPIAPVPATLMPFLSRPKEKAVDASTPVAELDTPSAIAYAEDLVRSRRGAEHGERNGKLFQLACVLKDKGLSFEYVLPLLLDDWCPRCDPPYDDEREIEKTVASAYNNGQKPPGIEAAELEFDDVSTDPDLATWHALRHRRPNLLERASDVRLEDILERQSNALVKGLLHPGDAAILYGESTAGKSFIGLDLAWHIALGKPWHGRKVNKAPVLYVALEGVDGFRKRILAAKAVHGDPGLFFSRLNLHVSLTRAKAGQDGMNTILQAAAQIAAEAGQPVGAIIIDTFARATAGDDENATDAVMHFVDHRAGAIARETGAAVMTVAHTNRNGDLRGSLHLRNPMDVVLKVERRGDDRTVVGEKVKDGQEGPLFDFTLQQFHLGEDEDNEAVTSCTVRAAPPKPRRVTETASQQRLRAANDTARAQHQGADPPLADVRDAFMSQYPTGERDPAKASAMKRAAWSRAWRDRPRDLEPRTRGNVEYLCAASTTEPTEEFEPVHDRTHAHAP